MHKWYVIQVLSGQEKKVKKTLEEMREREGVVDFVEEVLLPTERVSEMRSGEQTVTERRIWPGYLLVKMTLNDKTWAYVKNSTGVIDFLGGGTPTALSDAEVNEILVELKSKKETITAKHQFAPGNRVKINDGVFINFIGTVTDVMLEKGRLNCVVSIFGRDTEVTDLEFWQVERVAE
ncbi:MAG: transcription termination/antitermination protein NusG [Verrucomicrobia bacterium]|nr:transcription termination/antitermination protein NusG [Verrucomicrobiota bacterium]